MRGISAWKFGGTETSTQGINAMPTYTTVTKMCLRSQFKYYGGLSGFSPQGASPADKANLSVTETNTAVTHFLEEFLAPTAC